MFFTSKSKHFPYLSDYLTYMIQSNADIHKQLGIAGAVLGTLGGFFGVTMGLLANTGMFQSNGGLILTSVLAVNAAAWGGLSLAYFRNKKRKEQIDPEVKIFAQARKVAAKFHAELMQRKLHRALHPSVADLLEIAARNWKRTRDALDGSFWSEPDLPDHWRVIRDQASKSADRGMAEIMLHLQDQISKDTSPHDLQEAIEQTLEHLGIQTGSSTRRGFDHLPVEFHAARDVAARLETLAEEIETASKRVLASGDMRSRLNAARSIDDTLSELRTIRDAEEELRQSQ